MPAYIVADMNVTDPAGYEEYKRLAPAAIAKYGGRYIARAGETAILEGDWTPSRLVIIEFPSIGKAKEWYDSPEYRVARGVREGKGKFRMVVTEGL
jgi:uncharacterized protein (DUF1330 family)